MSEHPQLGITVDCVDAQAVARFWCHALGCVVAPPPEGWDDWPGFLTDHGVPEDEWGDGATIRPATGDGPSISFLKVPETKTPPRRPRGAHGARGRRRRTPRPRRHAGS